MFDDDLSRIGGGICFCPDGKQYIVTALEENCKNLACENGTPDVCFEKVNAYNQSVKCADGNKKNAKKNTIFFIHNYDKNLTDAKQKKGELFLRKKIFCILFCS